LDELKSKHGINKLDLVIANAAIMEESVATARIDTVDPADFEKHWRVNVGLHLWAQLPQATTDCYPDSHPNARSLQKRSADPSQVLGTLVLFQATIPLIPSGGMFIFMSSGASVIDRVPDKNDVAYGTTKVCILNPLLSICGLLY